MTAKKVGTTIVLFLVSMVFLSCTTGISQEQYDTVVEQRDNYFSQLTSAQEDIEALQEVCPPRYFSTVWELENWLAANTISDEATSLTAESWMRKALRLQQDALQDGYVISVDYDSTDEYEISVWCTAIINGKLYYWDPEMDEVFEEYSLGTLQ